ncbi:MAG: hypothetical protein VKM97_01550 [Cyanobacteriota bacterium]|nr:hypothetical protein [Cyanobacteriota bacterium]
MATCTRLESVLPRLLAFALPLAGPLPATRVEAVPQPPPPPLNPAWAFDPQRGVALPGSPPSTLLLPGDGGAFRPSQANQPLVIGGSQPRLVAPCPLIVPVKDIALQPLHIPPGLVPLKNSFGCLSAGDAIYGPDGCPRRLCGEKLGNRIPLPAGGP